MKRLFFLLLVLWATFSFSQVKLGVRKAFPTALGYAEYTEGNLTNNVYLVTNLNASGTGSLANTKSMSNVTIQFDVGGEIDFDNKFEYWTGNNVTFSFETAPSPVVMRRGAIMLCASESILRHLVGRRGYEVGMEDGGTFGGPRKSLNVRPVVAGGNLNNVIIDHFSGGLAHDETISIRDDRDETPQLTTNNVTLQNSLITSSYLKYGVLVFQGPQGVSLLRNGYFNIGDRTPESTRGQYSPEWEQANSLIYNYSRPTVASFGSSAVNINNAYALPVGASTPPIDNMRYQVGSTTGLTELDGQIWSDGNIEIGITNATGMESSSWITNKNQTGSRFHSSSYMPFPATEVVNKIFDDVGATAWGSVDPLDIEVKNDFLNGTGSYIIPTTKLPASYASTSHSGGYWATGNRVSQAFKDLHGFADEMTKPDFFTINGITFDNRAYENGSYVKNGVTVNEYQGGNLVTPATNNYTWWDIFRFELAKDFETSKWPDANGETLTFYEDFENIALINAYPHKVMWLPQPDANIVLETGNAREGNYAARFTGEIGNAQQNWPGREEISMNWSGNPLYRINWFEEYWIGFSLKVIKPVGGYQIATQIHKIPIGEDFNIGASSNLFAITTEGYGNLTFNTATDPADLNSQASGALSDLEKHPVEITNGKWIDIAMHVYFADDNTGYIQIKVDGKIVVDIQNQANIYPLDVNGNRTEEYSWLKGFVYSGHPIPLTDIHVDALRFHRGAGSYDLVAPRGDSAPMLQRKNETNFIQID